MKGMTAALWVGLWVAEEEEEEEEEVSCIHRPKHSMGQEFAVLGGQYMIGRSKILEGLH